MNVYRVYNLPILLPILLKAFQYSLEENLALSSDVDYATTQSEHDIFACLFTKGPTMCWLDTSLYPNENITLSFCIICKQC